MRIRIRDLVNPGSGIRNGKNRIRNKRLGFATLLTWQKNPLPVFCVVLEKKQFKNVPSKRVTSTQISKNASVVELNSLPDRD